MTSAIALPAIFNPGDYMLDIEALSLQHDAWITEIAIVPFTSGEAASMISWQPWKPINRLYNFSKFSATESTCQFHSMRNNSPSSIGSYAWQTGDRVPTLGLQEQIEMLHSWIGIFERLYEIVISDAVLWTWGKDYDWPVLTNTLLHHPLISEELYGHLKKLLLAMEDRKFYRRVRCARDTVFAINTITGTHLPATPRDPESQHTALGDCHWQIAECLAKQEQLRASLGFMPDSQQLPG
jgi:3' exoribonuclease, RNase T-like